MDFSKHTDGTTSVKVHHAPGGKSNFSLGWSEEPKPAPKKENPQAPPSQPQQQATSQPQAASTAGYSQKGQQQQTNEDNKTSVKVHNPPGGKSNFTLG